MSDLKVISFAKAVAVAGTAEALSATVKTAGFLIKANSGNTGNIYLGDSGVTSANGLPIAPGEMISVGDMEMNGTDRDFNLAQIFINATTSGDAARIIYVAEQ